MRKNYWSSMLVTLFLSLCSSFAAAESSSIDRKELINQATDYERALLTNDIETVVAAMPPRLVKAMAAPLKLDVEAFKAKLIDGLRPVMAKIKVELAQINVDAMTLSSAGAKTPFALLPSVIIISQSKVRVRKKTNFVAVMDNGKWYFDRVDNASRFKSLSELYPSLAELKNKIKPASVQRLK